LPDIRFGEALVALGGAKALLDPEGSLACGDTGRRRAGRVEAG
jgi:hypothetical protein